MAQKRDGSAQSERWEAPAEASIPIWKRVPWVVVPVVVAALMMLWLMQPTRLSPLPVYAATVEAPAQLRPDSTLTLLLRPASEVKGPVTARFYAKKGDRLDVLALEADCVASSGDYEQAYTRDLRYHHIIDPRTGRSPEHTSGVTVVGPTAMDADAISTSAFVLGPSEGVAFLDRLDHVEGMVIGKDQQQFRTRGFGRYLT